MKRWIGAASAGLSPCLRPRRRRSAFLFRSGIGQRRELGRPGCRLGEERLRADREPRPGGGARRSGQVGGLRSPSGVRRQPGRREVHRSRGSRIPPDNSGSRNWTAADPEQHRAHDALRSRDDRLRPDRLRAVRAGHPRHRARHGSSCSVRFRRRGQPGVVFEHGRHRADPAPLCRVVHGSDRVRSDAIANNLTISTATFVAEEAATRSRSTRVSRPPSRSAVAIRSRYQVTALGIVVRRRRQQRECRCVSFAAPEPDSAALGAVALASLAWIARRRRMR